MPEREFGATAWGRAWLRTIERTDRTPSAQLPKARSLARNQRAALTITSGTITAAVTDANATHQVEVHVPPWDEIQAARAESVLADGPTATVIGDLPDSLAAALTEAGAPITVPLADTAATCTCRARTRPCAHILAALYGLILLVDERPATAIDLRTQGSQRTDTDDEWIALTTIRSQHFTTSTRRPRETNTCQPSQRKYKCIPQR